MHQVATTPAPPKKRRSRRKRYLILGSISLVVLGIIVSIILGRREKPIPVTTEKAIRKTILQTVSATGKVQPEVEVKISPEVAGEIIELPVVDGIVVKKGDLLLKILPDSYKALVEQQDAAISGAKAVNLQQKATLAKAELDLKRAKDLFAKKMISESDFSVAQTARDVALSTVESSQHGIESAEAASSQARDQLLKTTIYSPIDGTITILNSKLGERVVAALSPYIRQHINRFGRYQLDLTQPPPPLNYDIRVVTSKKKSAGFVASETQKKAKAKSKKKRSARQMKLFS